MRIEVKNEKEAEELSKKFEECHIERVGDKTYVVVDKAKRKVRV